MLKLVQVDNGVFDLQFDDPALNDPDATIRTVVYAALFTDAEAPERRVADRYERRGWWADPEAGSGLWHVRWQGLSEAARREALFIVRQALLEHGVFDVSVVEQIVPGNVSSLFMRVSGLHNGRNFDLSIEL